MPDDELLDLAASGRLLDTQVLRTQESRMLEDPKAKALSTNFANQWLNLRVLDQVQPDRTLFPRFDESLRASMKGETE